MQFSTNVSFLQDAVSRWFAPALNRGGGAVVIARPENWRAVRMSLRSYGLNPSALEAEGRIAVLDVHDFIAAFMQDGRPSAEHFQSTIASAVAGVRRVSASAEVRVWGEAVQLLRQYRNVLAAQFLEALWHEAIATHDLEQLCSYELDPLDPTTQGEPMSALEAHHDVVIPAPDYARLNRAVEDMLVAVLGTEAAGLLLADFWLRGSEREAPIGQRVLTFLQDTRPRLAARLLALTGAPRAAARLEEDAAAV